MNIAVVDCGSGNLRSVVNALRRVLHEDSLHATAAVTADPAAVRQADRIVLPGVGAFAACRAGLRADPELDAALTERVRRDGVPFLGICVGMQLLAATGYEHITSDGLGWLGGAVRRIPEHADLRIPHMGWSDLGAVSEHPVLADIRDGDHVYFVHSYHYEPDTPADVIATVDYGGELVAAVARGNIVGTQFHPEKSQAVGLRLLRNFLRWRP